MFPIPTTIRQSSTGLWSFELGDRMYRVGYLTKWHAVAAARDIAAQVFGRACRFTDATLPV